MLAIECSDKDYCYVRVGIKSQGVTF
jgi:hypothetical protein